MAYNPTSWVNGDTITATKLNKLEQGVANAVTILTYSDDHFNLTVREIIEAMGKGIVYFSPELENNYRLSYIVSEVVRMTDGDHAGEYRVAFLLLRELESILVYGATLDSYPVIEESE